MAIRAIVFDIGGVMEITPNLGVDEKWEKDLGMEPGELGNKLGMVWHNGGIGKITEAEVHQQIGELAGLSETQVNAYMDDVWKEYLGTPNTELIEYYASLRPRFKTGILSNSFVGAREREQALYHFGDMTDVIVYSHEVGLRKPDPRIYTLTYERLGVQPHEMIFLDDHDDIVEPARKLGIHGVTLQTNAQVIAEIEAIIKANA